MTRRFNPGARDGASARSGRGKVGVLTLSWKTPVNGRRDKNESAGNAKPPKLKHSEKKQIGMPSKSL